MQNLFLNDHNQFQDYQQFFLKNAWIMEFIKLKSIVTFSLIPKIINNQNSQLFSMIRSLNPMQFSPSYTPDYWTPSLKCESLTFVHHNCSQNSTMLQKFSKCELKAAWYGNSTILMPLKFCVKSYFGKIRKSKKAIPTVLGTV